MPASYASSTNNPDRLLASEYPTLSRKVIIDTGVLVRGAVLGKITATGKYILSLSAAGDGSQTPDAILGEDVDATAADKEAIAYFRGDFNEDRLTLGAAHTVDTIREGLRDKGIWLVKRDEAV